MSHPETYPAGRCVSVYLVCSYLYYIKDLEPPLTDAEYDALCKRLLSFDPEAYAHHPHAHLIDPEALEAGTAYHLSEKDYPRMVEGAAMTWAANRRAEIIKERKRKKRKK